MKYTTLVLLFGALTLQGCAHSTVEKQLDSKLSQEPAVKNTEALRAEVRNLIDTTPGLSAEQRTQLSSLQKSTQSQMVEMRNQSLKLRSLLIKDLISTEYNSDEVSLIKSRIKELDHKRLTLLFDTVEKANTILGRQAAQNQAIMRSLFDRHNGMVE